MESAGVDMQQRFQARFLARTLQLHGMQPSLLSHHDAPSFYGIKQARFSLECGYNVCDVKPFNGCVNFF